MHNQNQRLRLFRFVKPVLPVYIAVVFINLLFVGLDMLSPQISRRIVDDVIVGGDSSRLGLFLGGILAIGVARALLGYTRELSCDAAGSRIGSEVSKDFFAKLQSLSADFFDRNNPGELMARVLDDSDKIWGFFSYVGMLLCEIAVHFALILYSMFRMDWRLALIPALSLPAGAFIALRMEKRLGELYEEIGEENQLLNNTAQENLNAVRTVKSFVREEFEIQKFKAHNEKYCALNYKTSQVFVRYHPIFQCFRHLLPLAVLVFGGTLAMREELTLGELTAFIQYSMNFVWPLEMLGWLTSGVSQAKASVRRLDKIYAELPSVCDDAASLGADAGAPKILGGIEYKNVSFSAESGKKILDGVSFKIEPGQTLGIMGATGSGKTTVVNLLKRMYDATGGEILIDGTDIKEIPLEVLRKSIAAVMQDVFLFSESIGGNVRLGEKAALADSAVQKAMRDSASDEFVSKLENKDETVIGERGVGLSGGQKQRLTMARAMSRNAPILVFDDSTSALDSETERRVQATLAGMRGMTKIIIAHRISSVKNADKIIVLEGGRVAESGSHESLMALGGLYRETYLTQYGGRSE